MNTIKKLFLFLFVSLSSSILFSQDNLSIGFRTQGSEVDTFVRKVEGAGDFLATAQSADGGYVTVSYLDETTVLVRRFKASGKKGWERRLDLHTDTSLLYLSARVNGITQTTDGGFVLAGQVDCDYVCWEYGSPMLIKLRSDGTFEWNSRFALEGIQSFIFSSVTPMPDGGVMAAGVFLFGEKVTNQFFVVRFTATGSVVWAKKYKNFPDTNVFSRQSSVNTDDGLVLAFTRVKNINQPNGVDVLKIKHSGNVAWVKRLKADGFIFQSIGSSSEGGVILTGTTKSHKLNVVALKRNGILNWKAEYSLRVPGKPYFVSTPIQMPNGEYAITGSSYDASTTQYHGFIAKIDSSQKIVFQNTFGNGETFGESVFATANGGFVLFGGIRILNQADNAMLILKMNSEGLVPACLLLETHELGSTSSGAFDSLSIAGAKIKPPTRILLVPEEFSPSSTVAHYPDSTICN